MRWATFAIGLLAICLASLSAAQTPQVLSPEKACAAPDYPTDVRPEPHEDVTEVSMGMRVFDITEINDVNQTITIDIAFRMSWVDPRLADKAGCRFDISQVWFPATLITNSGRLFQRWPKVVAVSENGRVNYAQRMSGTLSGYQNLKDFPFDHQDIQLKVVSLDWSAEKLRYVADQQFTGINYPLNISDWSIRSVTGETDQFFLDAVQQDRSAFVLTVSADRHASFYVWKIIMPLTLIVIMSWCPFWIKPTDFGTQLGLSASSVLTMVAFIFATTSMMPVLGYFTLMDRYIALCTIFVFLGLLQSLTSGYVASKGHKKAAVKIDHASRVLFPISFFAVAYVLYSLNSSILAS